MENNEIQNLSGIGNLTNLSVLDLSSNEISNLDSLSTLTRLQDLDLEFNSVSDLSSLSGLQNLEILKLGYNQVASLDPLAGLSSLREAELSYNQVEDIDGLAGLTNLHVLDLDANRVGDVSSLAGLVALQDLQLWMNQVEDVTPLANLSSLESLDLENNKIRDLSSLANLVQLDSLLVEENFLDIGEGTENQGVINALIQAGVSVSFEGQKEARMEINSEVIQLAGKPGETVSFTVILSNSGPRPLEYNFTTNVSWIQLDSPNGILARDESKVINLIYGPLPSFVETLTGKITIQSNDPDRPLTDIPVEIHLPVVIPDSNLKAVIAETLGLPLGSPVSANQLATLTNLYAFDRGIMDLTGIEYAVNLVSLQLNRNQIRDLQPLTGLTKLEELRVRSNFLDGSRNSPNDQILTLIRQYAFVDQGGQRVPMRSVAAWFQSVGLSGDTGIDEISGRLGIPNLLAFAMGLNPFTSDPSQLPSIRRDDSTDIVSVTYFRDFAITGADLKLMVSSDLLTYQSAQPVELQVLWNDGNGRKQIEARFEVPDGPVFFRLEATAY
jgi:Leucine-rich repeat (LRR) protein